MFFIRKSNTLFSHLFVLFIFLIKLIQCLTEKEQFFGKDNCLDQDKNQLSIKQRIVSKKF